jgi:DNA-binding protein YbaB
VDIQERVSQAMEQLERNVQRAMQDPDAVLQGSFKGTSGAVTVWVDAVGRAERFRIEPGAVQEGDEKLIMDQLMEANRKAQHAAENLDVEGADTSPNSGSNRRPDDEDWGDDNSDGSYLHSI